MPFWNACATNPGGGTFSTSEEISARLVDDLHNFTDFVLGALTYKKEDLDLADFL